MKNEQSFTGVLEQYAAAYLEHYTTKDLNKALGLYRSIMTTYPDSKEAGYSRTQVLNIVNSVMPKVDIFNAQVDLLLTHLKSGSPAEAELVEGEEHADVTAKR